MTRFVRRVIGAVGAGTAIMVAAVAWFRPPQEPPPADLSLGRICVGSALLLGLPFALLRRFLPRSSVAAGVVYGVSSDVVTFEFTKALLRMIARPLYPRLSWKRLRNIGFAAATGVAIAAAADWLENRD